MDYSKRILVTGGAGFIGSALVRYIINKTQFRVINIDKLTYAGNLESLHQISTNERYEFEKVDICDKNSIEVIFKKYKPNVVIHLAAESHVDRSIDDPGEFINTNILGTYTLLEVSRAYYRELSDFDQSKFRLLHVSTDEVYGSLRESGFFTENKAYKPNSPYSASKASSDHLVRAWFHTFNLPTLITNCSNNYGPFQFPEKLIPVVILNALKGKEIPVYGEGKNIRDWLYVEDHVRAILSVLEKGSLGETYLIGGHNEKTNLEIVHLICDLMNKHYKKAVVKDHNSLITFVKDRPGHDLRYAIDPSKIMNEIGWKPQINFDSGIENTVLWYLNNLKWCENILNGSYRLKRIGLGD